ncbi:hypothetical protein F4819DRAFT_336613 [Hypoxylon fuscum]|nr:hypothetical protein F4819DRAFT_336613 [Hypoxylon fuscum]
MSWQCDTCNRRFGTWRSREQHLDALGHERLDYDCHCCDDFFASLQDRRAHEVSEHFRCADCKRTFANQNSLKMHLNSRTHRGSSMTCPFCKTGFATATGVAHHLEGSHCSRASSLNRDVVYNIVRSKDPTGIISKKLIGWHGSSTYEATDQTWNGSAFECYFCHRTFSKLSGLNQHLTSPIHQQALYHCPNRNACGREFKSIAAIMNHLESESCAFTRFENVQKSFSDLISADRRLTFG